MISDIIKQMDLRFQYKAYYWAQKFPLFAIETNMAGKLVFVFIEKEEAITFNKEKQIYTYNKNKNNCKLISTKTEATISEKLRGIYKTEEILSTSFKFPTVELLEQLPILESTKKISNFFRVFEYYLSFTIEYCFESKINKSDPNLLFETIFKNISYSFIKVSYKNKLFGYITYKNEFSCDFLCHDKNVFKDFLIYLESEYKDFDFIFNNKLTTNNDFMYIITDDEMVDYVKNSTARKLNDF